MFLEKIVRKSMPKSGPNCEICTYFTVWARFGHRFANNFLQKHKKKLESKICKILILEHWKCCLLVPYQISLDKNVSRWVEKFTQNCWHFLVTDDSMVAKSLSRLRDYHFWTENRGFPSNFDRKSVNFWYFQNSQNLYFEKIFFKKLFFCKIFIFHKNNVNTVQPT